MMRNKFKNLQRQLADESGETIVETMVSVLITSLALLLLATAIGTSIRIIQQSKSAMGTMYAQESEMVKQSEPVAGATDSGESGTYESAVRIVVSGESQSLKVYQTENGNITLYKRGG